MCERSTMATINMNPLKGNAIPGIGPELTFAIIDRKGMMDICFPCSTIEPVMEKLTNWYRKSTQGT